MLHGDLRLSYGQDRAGQATAALSQLTGGSAASWARPGTYLRPFSRDPDILAGLQAAALTVWGPLAGTAETAVDLSLLLVHAHHLAEPGALATGLGALWKEGAAGEGHFPCRSATGMHSPVQRSLGQWHWGRAWQRVPYFTQYGTQ